MDYSTDSLVERYQRFTHWLHTRWPAGTVEALPECDQNGRTNVPGLYISGDLTGIPLLKFSADSGVRAVRAMLAEPDFQGKAQEGVLDIAIIGAGVSGISAAMEAKKAGLNVEVYEATQIFSTVTNFPKAKPIYTYPTEMRTDGLQFTAQVKEPLLEEMDQQRRQAGIEPKMLRVDRVERAGDMLLLHHPDGHIRARRVLVAIGRSGNFRKLNVPGEELDKVTNRLHDPHDFVGKNVLVVGGGDTALETAIALGACGAHVTLSYRGAEFSRPKPENIEKLEALEANPDHLVQVENPTSDRVSTALTHDMQKATPSGSVRRLMKSAIQGIEPDAVTIKKADGEVERIPNDQVFSMIGREAPLDFFRRSGVRIRGEWTGRTWASFSLFFLFCTFVYLWKAGTPVKEAFKANHWFPFNVPAALYGAAAPESAWDKTLAVTLEEPGFYYSALYCVLIVVFGIRRIQRRKTPYVKAQTLTLTAVQIIPLFLLPYFMLPMAGHLGWFDSGFGKGFADAFFPAVSYGHGREYWRAFGFVLAWPLFFWNLFSSQPQWWWLALSLVQTCVIIPWIVIRWGKGAYCGWICSCGALAETLGDTHRHKMPHGPKWNRLNMVGQVILWISVLMLVCRVLSWLGIPLGVVTDILMGFQAPFNYYYIVDIILAGIVGVGLYFWFSGRVWCRFACPLAALMHIYARFSKFRIFPEKKKCISCNVCTSVCHQGIDIMNFANKGVPMEDPECVRCSACVQQCPTGVLTFGRLEGGVPLLDKLSASPVKIREH